MVLKGFKEANFFGIVEAGDGLVFEIVIIKEGLSQNGNYYPKETLLKSRSLFEGAKVAFYEWNGLYDHLSDEAREKIQHGFAKQVLGAVTNVKFNRLSDGDYGLTGLLTLTESNRWLAELFKLGLDTDNKEILGFSIDVLGESVKEKIDGVEYDVIKEIGVVNEITVVTNPAAGGALERMVAGLKANRNKEKIMKQELIKLIACFRPKKLDTINIFEAEENDIVTLAKSTANELKDEVKENPQLVATLEELLKAIDSGDGEMAKALAQKALEQYNEFVAQSAVAKEEKHPDDEEDEEEKKKKAAAAAKKDQESSADVIEIKKAQENINKRLSENEQRVCEATLRANLAESHLPAAAKEKLKERFTGKSITEEVLKKEIEKETKYLSKLAESLHPNGLRIEIGANKVDKVGDAIQGMLAGKDINKVPRFKGIHEAFCKADNVSPYSLGFKEKLWFGFVEAAQTSMKRKVEAIQTSTFAEILGDRLHKQMVNEYNEEGLEDWRKITNISDAPDFLTQRRTRLGGYGTNMPIVAEAAVYTALTSPADEEATYSVAKRGGLETISMEAVKNDNLRALQLIPKRLGRGAKNTLYQFVFDFIQDNANIYDGTAYFVAGHNNLRTVALSYSEFNNVVIAMMDQAAFNEANFFPENMPKYLLVPNELWLTAMEIAKATKSTTSGRAETVENMFKEFALEVIRVAYWTDANDWATMADPNRIPTIEIGFLDGNEEPELLQEAANSGSDFTNDQIRWKLRHIYGGAVIDFISAHKNEVA